MPREVGAARIRHDQLGSGFRGVLDPGRGDGVIHRRVRADHEDDLRVHHVAHLVRHGSGVDPFHQRRDARGVAQARAVIDVVRSESGADQLLEQVGFLVRALGRTETGERSLAVRVADVSQSLRGKGERLVPGRFAEHAAPVVGIDGEVLALLHPRLADERRGEPMLVLHVVEAVPALDAQPARVGRAVLALHVENRVALDVVRELAADAAVWADRLHLPVGHRQADVAGRHERAGRARLHALAAGDAGGVAHRIVEVEHDLRLAAAEGVADDVVHLLLAAGADAAPALDAGVEVDGDRRMRQILQEADAAP